MAHIMSPIESESSGEYENDKRRLLWDKPLSFILAAVGSAAGLGNLWRFPYLAATYVFYITFTKGILFLF